jgi:hypothetical protein
MRLLIFIIGGLCALLLYAIVHLLLRIGRSQGHHPKDKS